MNKQGIRKKVLKNDQKNNRISGTSKGRIGLLLPIRDRNGEVLRIGDHIKYGEYEGILLYNHNSDQHGIAVNNSMWYGEDVYNIDSYGKFVPIPMDNGARMEILKI